MASGSTIWRTAISGPLAIVQALAGIVAECLFIKIPEKVKRLHADIGAMDTALQQRPEVLQTVGMDFTAHVLYRVVDHFVLKFVKPFIRFQGIGKDRGPGENMIPNLGLQSLFL